MVLKTEGVSKYFGDLRAVDNVDLEIEEGEIYGIAGPNGAGKTTLFNVISGLWPPSSGKVIFKNDIISGLKPYQICHKGIARTFQISTVFATLTVLDNIKIGAVFGAKTKKLDSSHINEIMEFLGIQNKKDTIAQNLELYTMKLVMLAAALATDCKLLLLDEPMAGLTIAEIDNFLQIIRKMNKEWGITIMIIEHLIDTLIDISDRIIILDGGKVIYKGLPEELTKDKKVIEVYLGKGEE